MTQIIKPKDKNHWLELRCEDVTSTESSALFDLSPYITEFELWHRKKNKQILEIEENDRMKWGSRLEASIAEGVITDNQWKGEPFKDYMRICSLRMGSSFDWMVNKNAILEIKNVDSFIFKNEWAENEDGTFEAPPHIEIQVQHQLAVCGYETAYIAALVGGNRVVLIKRKANPKIIESIKTKINAFWASIDNDQPPQPDMKKDSQFICNLYNYAEPGSILDVKADLYLKRLAEKYKIASEAEKHLKEEKDAVKAELLMAIGGAEKAYGDQFTISAGIVGPKEIAYVRKPYRSFRINWKKDKDE